MSSMLIFSLIVLFGLIPFGFVVMKLIFKKTIVFKVALLVFISSMICSILAYSICYYGPISTSWVIPLCIIMLLVDNIIIQRIIQKPIVKLRERIDAMGQGKFSSNNDESKHKQDEIGDIYRSVKTLSSNLHNTALFADAIANNDFDREYEMMGESDELGKSLLNMRNELKEAKASEEKRNKEQEKDAWTANGIAEFSELLRQEASDLESLGRIFISKLTDYTGAIQGGVFVINEDDPEHIKYELQGAVAFNRVKHMEKEFELGIGLVGQCAYEKAPIFLNNTPDSYMEITSGLGESNPRFALLTPAIMNDKVYAVIELASFSKIEDYKINFISKISEAFASTISAVKINASTAKLLEESKEKAAQLEQQSEIMKQNIEELTATQEELARKDAELEELTRLLKEEGKL